MSTYEDLAVRLIVSRAEAVVGLVPALEDLADALDAYSKIQSPRFAVREAGERYLAAQGVGHD